MKPYYHDDQLTLYHGDALAVARELPDRAVDCIVSSPPYYALRDYGDPGQYGLEDTPADYVEHLRALFFELRRVLAADGTCWLVLGDSYSSRKGAAADDKNLMGMPWRVARALQQPQYVGKIHNEADRAWLAAMVDGEGCIAMHRRMSEERKRPTFAPVVQVANTNLGLLERCQQVAGVGTISHSDRGRNRRIYRWCVMSNQARQLLRELYPHLIAKQPQARAAVAASCGGGRWGESSPGAERAWLEIKALNKGGTHDGGWPVPASMFTPGWILRNAIIWSKPNTMPESVTDRLASRYEHVFLFAKQQRYFFDLDAIREAHSPITLDRSARSERKPYSARGRSGMAKVPGLGAYGAISAGRRTLNEAGANPGDVWSVPTEKFPGAHFAVYPVALAQRAISAGCKPGGVVCDPFNGSGTTGLAAQKTGHHYIGIDISRDYLDLALSTRLSQAALDF